jgi:hypothetical protein
MIVDLDSVISEFWRANWNYPDQYVIDNSGLYVEMLEFTYDQPVITRQPTLVASTTFSNGTDATATQSFADTKTTTASFKWSLTEGLKLGAKTSFKVGAPVFAEGKIEASIELSFSATQEQTTTESQSWQYGASIPVPPHSVVQASAIVSMAEYNPNWYARLRVTGQSVAWHGDNRTSGMSTYPNILCAGLPGFTVDNTDNSAVFAGSGTFEGAQGLSVDVKTKQSPYAPIDAASALHAIERATSV